MAVNDLQGNARKFKSIFSELEGAFIKQICMNADTESDELEISFFPVPALGEVTISLRSVRYFKVYKPPELAGSFVDKFEVTYLPTLDAPWPAEAEKLVTRFKGLPELIWLRMIGPTGIEVFCGAISVTKDGS